MNKGTIKNGYGEGREGRMERRRHTKFGVVIVEAGGEVVDIFQFHRQLSR